MKRSKRVKSIYTMLFSVDTDETEPVDMQPYMRGLDNLTPVESLFIRGFLRR